MEYGGCDKKQAREAPAGPAPTTRSGVSMVVMAEFAGASDTSPILSAAKSGAWMSLQQFK